MKSKRIVQLIDRRIERLKDELEDLEKARALLAGNDAAPARTKSPRSSPRRAAPAKAKAPAPPDLNDEDDEDADDDQDAGADGAPARPDGRQRPDGPFAVFREIMADGGEHTGPDLVARAAERKVRCTAGAASMFLSKGVERGDFERVAPGRYRARAS